jgi:hypothetical protein
MMATGRDWEYDPESQDEVAIQYAPDESKMDYIMQFNLNPEFEHPWREGGVTGVVENENEVWMHPFRSNQYIFTEVAAFPLVRFPLERGMSWTSNLDIYEGWGRWSNQTINNTYLVIGQEDIELEFGNLKAWHLKATTTAPFGNSIHDFWFHEEYGFIKMIVNNYANQVLIFELKEVR